MKRRLLALCLSLVMLVTMLPCTALAADTPVLTVGTATVEAGGTGSVTVSISGNTGFDTISFQIAEAEGLTINSVAVADGICNGWNNDYSAETRKFSAYSTGDAVTADGVVCTINFTADDSASGSIAISLEEDTNADGILMLEDEAVEGVTFTSGTITVGSSSPAVEGYTATLSTNASNNEVVSEGEITVNVGVSHSSDTVFNAGEIVLQYDSTKLTLVESSLGTLKYTNVGGKLTIEDFGIDKTMPYTYAIKFTAASVDTETATAVKLTSAKFVHKNNAATSDLIAANNVPLSLDVTIKVAMVNVTLTNNAGGSTTETTQKNQDYTFAPDDIANYDYTDVTATVGGQPVSFNDGTWTIPGAAVTDDIVITYTKTAKSYTVTINTVFGETTTPVTETATYNTAYNFTVPADVPAGTNVGYTYVLTSVTIDGTTYKGYSCAEGTRDYTIPGTDITGAIVITITKTEVPANTFTVTVDGSGAGNATINNENKQVASGDTASITVAPEAGYTYNVTAKMGDAVATVTTNGNTYTVANVTANVTFTVTKTLDVSTVAVTNYIQVDSYVVWLVTFDGTLANDKAPTYEGNAMYWSEKYEAYCYLVIAETLDVDTAKTMVDVITGTATDVNYSMNINGISSVVDAADAQMVWNMYNAVYSDFTTVTMAKFLAADQNATSSANWGLNVQDAQVIIDAILAGNANN